jgi:hypothetical protein
MQSLRCVCCLSFVGTGLFVSVKRGRTFASAEIESLTDDELQDLLRRASPSQVRAYCTWLVQWIRMKQRSEQTASFRNELKSKVKKN